MKKKIIALILACSMCSCVTAFAGTWIENGVATGQEGDIFVFVNERNLDHKVMITQRNESNGGPMLDDEYTLLMPISIAFEWGYHISTEDNGTKLTLNSKTIFIPDSGNEITIDGKAEQIFHKSANGTVYVPYTALEQLFDVSVSWDSSKKCLTVTERETTPISQDILTGRSEILNPPEQTGTELPLIQVAYETDDIAVTIDGKKVDCGDAKAFIDENERTQVPIRAVAEAMNFKVDWDGENHIVTITKDSDTVKIVIGSNIMTINGKEITMDTTAEVISDRTYIPIRFVGEALGVKVEWGM